MKRLLRITSYTGLSRYQRTLGDEAVGWIARQDDIPSPYRYGPSHCVYRDPMRGLVIIVETAHKRYDVFAVESQTIYDTDAEATDAYLAAKRV